MLHTKVKGISGKISHEPERLGISGQCAKRDHQIWKTGKYNPSLKLAMDIAKYLKQQWRNCLFYGRELGGESCSAGFFVLSAKLFGKACVGD